LGRTVAETIKEITRNHLTKNNGLLLGQAITAVGWVNNTVPNCKGIVELSMADVAGPGIAVGTAIVGRRPIFVVRFQDFLWLNSSPIVNYAAKTKDIFGVGTPIFVRALGQEGQGTGPVHAGVFHSLFMHMPGFKVCSPMTPKEYEEAWDVFMKNDDPMIVSEHRKSFSNDKELPDQIVEDADITIYCISAARFNTIKAAEILENEGIKCNVVHIMWLKPFEVTDRLLNPLKNSKVGLVVDSGFEIAGASQAISYELMYASGKPVKALGLKDHSVCVCVELENTTPSPEHIAEVARNGLKNEDRRKINAI
jgi:pyruvate dehydrogenase E1 component beta subunit